ncbi:GntR family transcriptional regulator [Pollutimonas harenae]|uniref:GntR family transcriptional regulator n=1 Tax=Pollutimonas harenae TaxID=657015 RepID=A0A853GWA2_9BURK|nr:GntR family transcriptional regulator [Pollutimonas harenae]NYT86417.1 GntR family transcriptional regulator [Pollutimonas harenae]TEA69831.1 GntR family transcriptional regulator [Pollutimonas harenae]
MKSKILDSRMPLYLQLAELMRQRIVRGEWPQGCKLPALEQLVKEFGVARVTVRHALGMLDRQGLVSRQQGRGTFVTHQPANDRWVNVVTTLDELAKVYRDTRPTIVNIDESTKLPTFIPAEGLARERYVFMRRIHSRDGKPYCVINIYMDDELFRRNPDGFRNQTVIPLLASMQVVADAHQTLTIGSADIEVARCLDLSINAPVAEVRRIFRNAAGEVIYLAEVTYRGDAIRFEMNLKP